MTIPGNEKERKLIDSKTPAAFVFTFTITYATSTERKEPTVAPAMPKKRLFLSDRTEIGSLMTVFQLSQLIAANAFAPGTMTYGTSEV